MFKVGDRVVALVNAPGVKYRGLSGTIVGVYAKTCAVEFDNPAYGGAHFKPEELKLL